MNWPDWQDSGKNVEIKMRDGRILCGQLFAEDEFFTGEDEVPLFMVVLEDGQKISFAECEEWKFI